MLICDICHRPKYLFAYLLCLLQRTDNILSDDGKTESGQNKILKYNPCEEVKAQRSKAIALDFYTSQGQIELLCDTITDGGRWIYIQKRTKGDTDFNRNWTDYSQGFGTVDTDFWLGNELIHQLTSWDNYELRIDMTHNGVRYYARYRHFKVDKEINNFRLTVRDFIHGSAPDKFRDHNGYSFSTPDRDNDDSPFHCGLQRSSGWWFHDCLSVNMNNRFVQGRERKGVFWEGLTGIYETLNSTEMKMRILQ